MPVDCVPVGWVATGSVAAASEATGARPAVAPCAPSGCWATIPAKTSSKATGAAGSTDVGVGEGVGVAVVPQATALRLASDRVVARPLSDAWATRQLMLCTAGDTPAGAGAAALYAFLARGGD